MNGKAVVAEFDFRYRDTVFSLQSGFDPEYSDESVGFLLRGHVLRELIRLGVRRFDLLAGFTEHKARLGATRGHYVSMGFARPFSRGSLHLHLIHGAQEAKELLRTTLHPQVWNGLRQVNARLRTGQNRKAPAKAQHRTNPKSDRALPQGNARRIAKTSLQVRIYETLDDLAKLVPSWEELLRESPTASVFNTWEYLAPWWKAFGNGQRLRILAFFDFNSRLVGLAPLALTTRQNAGLTLQVIRLMGDGSGDSDNLDIIIKPGFEGEVIRALFEYFGTPRCGWDICELNTLPVSSPSGRNVLRHLEKKGWPHFVHQQPRSEVILPPSWESYQELLSSKERGKIDYLSRRLEKKYAVRYYKCGQTSELNRCLEHLFQLHQERWELRAESGSFRSVARRDFYAEMGRLLLERGRLEFWLLELNGKTVAALFGFRYGDTVYALQEGFAPSYREHSVGYVLRAHMLRNLIAAGVHRYDFLAGMDPSKMRWGAQKGNYQNIRFARPYSMGSFFLKAVEGAKNAKEWFRGHLPRPVWAWLHWLNLLCCSSRSLKSSARLQR